MTAQPPASRIRSARRGGRERQALSLTAAHHVEIPLATPGEDRSSTGHEKPTAVRPWRPPLTPSSGETDHMRAGSRAATDALPVAPMKRWYRDGDSNATIGLRVGLHQDTVRRVLLEAGMTMRPRREQVALRDGIDRHDGWRRTTTDGDPASRPGADAGVACATRSGGRYSSG